MNMTSELIVLFTKYGNDAILFQLSRNRFKKLTSAGIVVISGTGGKYNGRQCLPVFRRAVLSRPVCVEMKIVDKQLLQKSLYIII